MVRESWGKEGGLCESQMCPTPDILSAPLYFLASTAAKQSQVASRAMESGALWFRSWSCLDLLELSFPICKKGILALLTAKGEWED